MDYYIICVVTGAIWSWSCGKCVQITKVIRFYLVCIELVGSRLLIIFINLLCYFQKRIRKMSFLKKWQNSKLSNFCKFFDYIISIKFFLGFSHFFLPQIVLKLVEKYSRSALSLESFISMLRCEYKNILSLK